MDISWHEYTDEDGANVPVTQASLTEKASIIGRVGIMLLSCGTGAWRVRSSMNTLAEIMGMTVKGVEFHISKATKELRVALKDYLVLFPFLCDFLSRN